MKGFIVGVVPVAVTLAVVLAVINAGGLAGLSAFKAGAFAELLAGRVLYAAGIGAGREHDACY